jgi:hypothetical protein
MQRLAPIAHVAVDERPDRRRAALGAGIAAAMACAPLIPIAAQESTAPPAPPSPSGAILSGPPLSAPPSLTVRRSSPVARAQAPAPAEKGQGARRAASSPIASARPRAEAAAKADLIARYFKATRLRATTTNMIKAMSQISPPAGLSPKERAIYDEVVAQVADEAFDDLSAEFASLYAQAFTVAELKQLVAFYESPVGQSLMSKTAHLTGQSAEIAARHNAYFGRTLRTRLCARIDCSPPRPVTQASPPDR